MQEAAALDGGDLSALYRQTYSRADSMVSTSSSSYWISTVSMLDAVTTARAEIAGGRQPASVRLAIDRIRQAVAGRAELERIVVAGHELTVGKVTGGRVVGRPATAGIAAAATRVPLDLRTAGVAGVVGETAEETGLYVRGAAAVYPLCRSSALGKGGQAEQAHGGSGERFQSLQHDYRPRYWRSARLMRANRVYPAGIRANMTGSTVWALLRT